MNQGTLRPKYVWGSMLSVVNMSATNVLELITICNWDSATRLIKGLSTTHSLYSVLQSRSSVISSSSACPPLSSRSLSLYPRSHPHTRNATAASGQSARRSCCWGHPTEVNWLQRLGVWQGWLMGVRGWRETWDVARTPLCEWN